MLYQIKQYVFSNYLTARELATETDIQRVEARHILDQLTQDGLLLEIQPETYILSQDADAQTVIQKINTEYNLSSDTIQTYF